MKLLRMFYILVIGVSASSYVYATAQIPDRLRFGGREHLLYSEPLEQRYADGKLKRPVFASQPFGSSTAMTRGYLATWEIRNGKLYLAEIDSWLCRSDADPDPFELGCRHVRLEDILGSDVTDTTRFANWFSGELRVPQGKQLLYVHNPYLSVYERDILFRVKAGIVEPPTIVDNTKKPIKWEYGWVHTHVTPLGSFDISAPPPDLLAGLGDTIVASSGLGKVMLAASRDAVSTLLGRGETIQRDENGPYFCDYGDSSIQITFEKETNTAMTIYFFNKDRQSARLRTDKGIGFDGTPAAVLKAHGEPTEIKRRAVGPFHPEATDYRFPGIEFRFENDKLVRIGVRK